MRDVLTTWALWCRGCGHEVGKRVPVSGKPPGRRVVGLPGESCPTCRASTVYVLASDVDALHRRADARRARRDAAARQGSLFGSGG